MSQPSNISQGPAGAPTKPAVPLTRIEDYLAKQYTLIQRDNDARSPHLGPNCKGFVHVYVSHFVCEAWYRANIIVALGLVSQSGGWLREF